MSSTQLISAESYDTSRMIFSEPQVGSIPNSKPAISFSRINISTRNDDGTTGELIISTEELYSFGVSENKDMETGRVNGYVMPLCLYNRNGPSEKEKAFVKTFTDIVEKCKDYLIDNKEDLGQYELERNDLKKLNPLYYKRDKGKIVEGASPMLYAKLIVSKKQDKTITVFFDRDTGDNIDALDLLGKYCYARAAIKIESIFIGNKISLQVKLYECEVKRTEFGMKRLLSRPQGESRVLNHVPTKSNPLPLSMDAEDDDDDAGSLVDMAEKEPEPIEETIKPVPKKIIKKVVKKKE